MIREARPLIRIKAFNESGQSPLNLGPAQIKAVEEFNTKIINGEIPLENILCLCGSEESDLVARVDRYGIYQKTVICLRCGLIQSNPRMTVVACRWFYESDTYRRLYDGSHFLHAYKENYEDGRGDKMFRSITSYKPLKNIQSVLEIGAGGGWNLLPFVEVGKKVIGYDLSPELVQMGRQRNIPLIQGDVKDVNGIYDVIILNHVLEHFPNPLDATRLITNHLHPEGILYIGVPDIGQFSLEHMQNAHNYYFTLQTLQHYMARCGLQMCHHQYEEGGHMSALFRAVDTPQDIHLLEGHYDEMIKLFRKYVLKYQVKRLAIPVLDALGLTDVIRRRCAQARQGR